LLWAPGGEPDSLDPASSLTALGEAVGRPIFDCLVGLGSAFEPRPALAEHWETSADGTRYSFLLRAGVSFQDGTPLDAEAVRYSLERLLGPERPNRRGLLSGLVRQVRVVDRLRLEVVLEAPFGPFVHHLAQFGAAIVSPTAHRAAPSGFGRQPVGTGPFRLTSWRPGEEIVLGRWNDGWRGRPALDRIVIRFEPRAEVRAELLEAGQVQLLGGLPLELGAALVGRPALQVDYLPSARALGISINTRAEGLGGQAVRQALNYAVDRATLIESVYGGQAEPLGGPLAPPVHSGPALPPYPFDLARARQLLAEAGLAGGLDLVLFGSQRRQPGDAALLQAIQPQLAAAGVRTRLELLDGAGYTAEATRAEQDVGPRLLLAAWLPLSGEARGGLQPLFHSSQVAPAGFNTSFFRSPTFDTLLDRATGAAGEAERASLYRQAVELLRTEAPWIYLLAPRLPVAGSSRLHEVVVTAGELVTVGERTWLE
jgi:ABC-type transport system substrate-binding protein